MSLQEIIAAIQTLPFDHKRALKDVDALRLTVDELEASFCELAFQHDPNKD